MPRRNDRRYRVFDREEYYACPDCQFGYTIWRMRGRGREKDHLKKLYCPNCNEDKNFKKRDTLGPQVQTNLQQFSTN